jgi:hypothetical protein
MVKQNRRAMVKTFGFSTSTSIIAEVSALNARQVLAG